MKELFYLIPRNGLPEWSNKRELYNFLLPLEGKRLYAIFKRETGVRSGAQNDSIHLYLTWVARELINKGYTLQDVVERIRKAEITPTKDNLKEVVWKPIQKIVLGKDSTTKLTKLEVNEVYEPMSMWLAKEFEIDLPFPHDPNKVLTYQL